MTEPGGGRWISLGLVVSLALHVFLVGLLVSVSAGAGVAHAPAPDRERSPDEIRFGLDVPPRATIDWLGIRDPTPEHIAPDEAESQQAALATDAAGGPASPPTQPSPQPEPATESPAASEAEQSPAAPVEAPREPEAILPDAPQSAEPTGPAEQSEDTPDPVLDAIERATPTRTEPTPTTPQTDAGTGPTQGTGPGDAPGRPSERESDATAKIATVDVEKWTSPVVGQGIEIRPVRPRWPTHFMLGRLPRPALIEITFHRPKDRPGGADGPAVVKLAEFARIERPDGTFEIRSSGDAAVDSIVLNTIYQWTATGAQIDELEEGKTLTVRVRLFSVR
ncbi:MAG: hypothetical protein RIB60_03715 [Phycisphaerales bacterium]